MSQGRLELAAVWDGAVVVDIAIRNSRPEASKLLRGRTPEQALAAVPLLFGVCRHGQTQAARAALALAGGAAIPQDGATAIAAEAAQEHLWRLLVDWPTALDLPVDRALFASWYQRLNGVVAQGAWNGSGAEFARFCEQRLLDRAAAAWLMGRDGGRLGPASLCAPLLAALETEARLPTATPTLPCGLDAQAYYAGMAPDWSQAFPRLPVWQGRPAETGALARWPWLRTGGGLAARVRARLADLALLALEATGRVLPQTRVSAFSPEPGVGFAAVETARGLLVHQVRLGQGRIDDYRIVAPTEWNFHPDGAFRDGLLGFRADDAEAVRRRAGHLALALDPCVPFNIAVD
ncbi:Nickel-dependent hydrogenase [Methylomagnum ishizawai]|uniref:Nickel-dependent hydrogenase n=1 Tax=Methylomagnum ishizawai TaxID=1760988 RepID=A0A1Y6DCD5_9GAMM|nr:nickel-dependent hydrogenase large subunit [Methylomagnum ishizawai]SMF97734.1 Nickel-dependent hydrogenase [Methylomagnum ishizawai]